MSETRTRSRPGGRSEDKRRALLRGALVIFGRDGYTRASIGDIAREAGVSTRTVYNHMRDKAELFEHVMVDSATAVADAQIEVIDRHLRKVTDLDADLIAFAREWATPMPAYVDHFAVVRQIRAESGHIPPAALAAWRAAGPQRVHAAMGRRMAALVERGLLDAPDPGRAGQHFTLLVATEVAERSGFGADPLPAAVIEEIATAGARVFLRAYRAAPAP